MTRIVYYFSEFPLLSTTFIQREIYELRRRGVRIDTIANRRPREGEFHPSDGALRDATFYLCDEPPHRVVAAHAGALVRAPLGYLGALCMALLRRPVFANVKHWLAAPVLGALCNRQGFPGLHVHFAFGAASVACFCSRIYGIPYSISIHGSDVLLPDPFLPYKLRGARAIVSNCDFHVGFLIQKHRSLKKERFHVVRIGLDCNKEPWLPCPFPAQAKPLRLLCVGRLVAVKAHWLLIEAIARARREGCELVCRIIGDGPLRLSLEKLVKELKLVGTVTLLGSRDEREVALNMEWAHAVALSSLSEGTPMTIIEALSKGRPVIAPDITAIPEMVRNEKTGFLFKKGSPESLTAVLRAVCREPDLERMGRDGREFVEMYHRVQTSAAMLAEIIGI